MSDTVVIKREEVETLRKECIASGFSVERVDRLAEILEIINYAGREGIEFDSSEEFWEWVKNVKVEDGSVVHAHWYHDDSSEAVEECVSFYWLCSNCGKGVTLETEYCPHCGAKMDMEK